MPTLSTDRETQSDVRWPLSHHTPTARAHHSCVLVSIPLHRTKGTGKEHRATVAQKRAVGNRSLGDDHLARRSVRTYPVVYFILKLAAYRSRIRVGWVGFGYSRPYHSRLVFSSRRLSPQQVVAAAVGTPSGFPQEDRHRTASPSGQPVFGFAAKDRDIER